MKFGEYLKTNAVPEWLESYINYDRLKKIIKTLEEQHIGFQQSTEIGTSLSVSRPTNAAGMPVAGQALAKSVTQEDFFLILDQEMKKIELFTQQQVDSIRGTLHHVESQIDSQDSKLFPQSPMASQLRSEIEEAGENFLKLEKYVNMNFTGFHKILKKHDRRLPNPCRTFYLGRLHQQSWVRGDFSDVIVIMSRLYSSLRGDEEVEATEDERQDFVRSTRKYWVHTEDISRVKYIILQHLPVFLQKQTMDGVTDSQLVNSVYLDNHSMELYHGRLDKTPGAIALRMRWYGTGNPETVFVERKTHRESWAGEVSVKERFVVPESQVQSIINGTFDLNGEVARLRAKGKDEESVREWTELATEVVQAINSKQLFPTMRTQYMRTAFQIPFDATVRISLDTNLTMISERTKEVSAGKRWYRDPTVSVPYNEITRFPHAVLEIKLQLNEEGATPDWVAELLTSGMLLEVHKFSKFIHGCSVLIPDEVVSVPYWIDDSTLAQSISQSGGTRVLGKEGNGANKCYDHLLPHDQEGKAKPSTYQMTSTYDPNRGFPQIGSSSSGVDRDYEQGLSVDNECMPACCDWAGRWESERMTTQKVEPKLFFANERTFIKWLQMAVVLSSIASVILAFSNTNGHAQFVALCLLPLAMLFIGYGLRQFNWRNTKIRTRDGSRWDDVFGPVVLTSMLVLALSCQFLVTLYDALSKL